jgi:hypothetical protein
MGTLNDSSDISGTNFSRATSELSIRIRINFVNSVSVIQSTFVPDNRVTF